MEKRVTIFRANFQSLLLARKRNRSRKAVTFFPNRTLFFKFEIPVFLMRFKGYSIVALEQLPASPLRTGAPFGGHQHR